MKTLQETIREVQAISQGELCDGFDGPSEFVVDEQIKNAVIAGVEWAKSDIPVGFLRQWINEDRTRPNQKLVTNEDILGFIEIGYNGREANTDK